jgi:hypothetical protein
MAVFLLKRKHGSAYTPPAATGNVFSDVPRTAFAAAWIERLKAEGITSGCGGGHYCPNAIVTRAQMAVSLLRAEHSASYVPPAPTGIFGDLLLTDPYTAWIEQLSNEGVTAGCGNGNYCNNANTRGQMAAFLVHTFDLRSRSAQTRSGSGSPRPVGTGGLLLQSATVAGKHSPA